MLVQNVQTNIQFASGIFSVSGEKSQGSANNAVSFSNLFNGITKSKNPFSAGTNEAKVNPSDGNDIKNVGVSKEPAGNGESLSNLKNALKDVKSKEETLNGDSSLHNKAADNAGEISEEDFEKVSACLVSIVVTVVEFFNITPEELQTKMDSLGMNASDLADLNSLKELFVSLDCDNDLTLLLTDQNLLEACDDLLKEISGILEDAGLNENMISSALTEAFGDESNFKLELLGRSQPETNKVLENLKDNENAEVINTETQTAEEESGKKLSIEFGKESESRNETNTDGKKRSVGEKGDPDMAEKFLNNMVNRFNQTMEEITGISKAVPNIRNIADQILEQIKINLTSDLKSLEIQLTPEHLGKVNVEIRDNDGVITAKFRTENQISKEAIESNMVQFKETLKEQGLKIDSVEVTVSDFSFNKDKDAEKNGNDRNENKNKRHFTLDEINEKVDGNDLRSQSYIDDGTSTVNYVA